MAKRESAGILLYRQRDGRLEVFLIHPGGPYWARRDLGAWSIPKGEFEPGEAARDAAVREFREETGFDVAGDLQPLTAVKQRGGKVVHAWAVRGDCDPAALRSNDFDMEWPPGSGRMQSFPEADRGAWFPLEEARAKLMDGQLPLLEELSRTAGAA